MASHNSAKIKEKLNNAISCACERIDEFKRSPKDFTRTRSLTPEVMVRTILGLHGQRLDKEMILAGTDVSASAFVQRRDKIRPEMFACVMKEFSKGMPVFNRYEGYRLLAVDGTVVTSVPVEDSPNYVPGGRPTKNGTLPKGTCQRTMTALYDVLNKQYLDVVPDKSENAAAKELFSGYRGHRAIVLADRGYQGYNLMEYVNKNPDLDYLIRVPETNYFSELKKLPKDKFDVDLEVRLSTRSAQYCKIYNWKHLDGPSPFGKPKKSVNWDHEEFCVMHYRAVRFGLKTGKTETIVTSLPREKFPPSKIKKLYNMRWGIETSFRELKYDIGMVHLHAKKDDSILQEIYAAFTMYNFCMAITMQIKLHQDPGNKHTYKIDIAMAVFLCMEFFRVMDAEPPDVQIIRYRQPERPGRSDERKLVPKGAIFFLYRAA